MSFDYSRRVWDTNLKGGKLLLMLALAQHADSKGECYPNMSKLARMARITDRQVRRVLNELEKSGHIVIEQRAIGRGKKPLYKMFPDKKADTMSDLKAEEMSGQTQKADKMSTIAPESGQNVRVQAPEEEKADILDNKSGHFDTVKADIFGTSQSHARSEHQLEHQEKQEEEEDAHAREPLTVAWVQAYGGDMPAKIRDKLNDLAKECGIAAVIHGIKSSAKSDSRNFKYIAECARNYVPPSNLNGYVSGPSYQVDIPDVEFMPGVHPLQPAPNGHSPPPLAHDDPWAIALPELLQTLTGSAPLWLEGSRLESNGELAEVPFYRLIVMQPGADTGWLTRQAGPTIRRKLANILRKPIELDIVHESRLTP